MATRAELEDALRAADAAGNAEDAQRLASALSSMPSPGMTQLHAIDPAPSRLKAQSDLDIKELRDTGGTTDFVHNAAAGLGKFATDQALAARQAAASFGLGDPAALAKEAAEKKALDASLSGSVGGKVGEIGGAVLEGAGPFGMATRAARMLPVGAAVRGMLPAATVGAGQGVLSPDEKYDPTMQAAGGAAAGMAGDVAGRGVGRALSPMQGGVSDTVRQYVETLRRNLPNTKLLAENISDSGAVKALTNALAQIPGFGGGIKAARSHNLGEVTEQITGKAGYPTKELSSEAAGNLHGQLDDTYDYLRRAPALPANGMAQALQNALGSTDLESRLLGTSRPAQQLVRAEGAVSPIPGPSMPPGVPPPPRVTPKIPVSTALDVRSELGDQVFRNEAGISSRGAETVRDELDRLLTNRFPDVYPQTQTQYGVSKDIAGVQNTPGGVNAEGRIRPEVFMRQLPEREVANPRSPFTQTMKAASERMSSPTLSEPRSLMVRLLTGGALAGLAGGGAMTGGGTGAMAGAGVGLGTLALAKALLGTEGGGRYLTGQNSSAVGQALQSPQMREFLRLLGTSTATDATQ